jgi:type II secretory pathway pseudopilin PulG
MIFESRAECPLSLLGVLCASVVTALRGAGRRQITTETQRTQRTARGATSAHRSTGEHPLTFPI